MAMVLGESVTSTPPRPGSVFPFSLPAVACCLGIRVSRGCFVVSAMEDLSKPTVLVTGAVGRTVLVKSTMSRRGKRKDSEMNGSNDESDSGAPSKKAPKNDSGDTDSIVVCEISNNRRVSVRSWQGKIVVDI